MLDDNGWIDRNFFSTRAPIMGIERHRVNSDGQGVCTLVGFYGCPLHCKYCLNNACHGYKRRWYQLSAKQLFRETFIDDIYFRMTHGGITFGGGEPALRVKYIKEFRRLCGNRWQINMETSLNVNRKNIEALLPDVDTFIVDIKDLNPEIYESYTLRPIDALMENLKLLQEQKMQHKVYIRVPLIPDYNTVDDQEKSIRTLKDMGFNNIEKFNYIKNI